MEKEEAQKNLSSSLKQKKLHCSKCDKLISNGEYYSRDILTKKITCMDCEDNRIYTNDENFVAIDEE